MNEPSLKFFTAEVRSGRMTLVRIRRACFILVALTFASVPSPAQPANATEVLAKVAAVYATCQSYSDEGSISANAYGFRNGYFRTTFVRPSHLAFELWPSRNDVDRMSGWVVWKSGDSIKSWVPSGPRPGPNRRKEAPLDTALDRLAGASAGSSLYISPLLLPASFSTTDVLKAMSDVRLAAEDKIDGRPAFRIEGKLWGAQEVRIWIDKAQYLIVKISRTIIVGPQRLESTVTLKPVINGYIAPERLLLKVPGEGTADPRGSNSMFSSGRPPTLAPRREFGWSLTQNSNAGKNASSKPGEADDEVVRVDTDLVVASVLVMDRDGKIISGLSKDDFVVKEDGETQEVATLSLGNSKEVPRSIVLIIDYSGSQLPYIQTSVEAARMLVDKLNPKDRMAIVTDDVNLLVDFTSDKVLLKSRLDGLRQNALSGTIGASHQYDALLATLKELFDAEDLRPIVIFQTDGDQLESLRGGTPEPPNWLSLPRKHGLADILTATEKSRATVYSVISGVRFFNVPEAELLKRAEADWTNRTDANRQVFNQNNSATRGQFVPGNDALQEMATRWVRRHTALAALAKFTGAWTEFLEQPGQANEIYDRILTDIDRRYVIGYYPTNRARDGKRRKVQIEVRDHPEYVVWGQKSYFAHDER